MTNLEKVLSIGLVGVTTFSAALVVQTIKHIKKDQQFLDEIQEKCNRIKNIVNRSGNNVMNDEESE